MSTEPRKYFSIKDACKYGYLPFSYGTALSKAKLGQLRYKPVGNYKFTCVDWINEYFESDSRKK